MTEQTEEWKLDFEWLRIRHYIKDMLGRKELPDLQSILFLIGIQELGYIGDHESYTKEEKQDLMHIAVCTLLEGDGYYEFSGRDQDGWPHWEEKIPFDYNGVKKQAIYLKEKIVAYFDSLEKLSSARIN